MDTVDRADQVRRVIELVEDGQSERSACETVGIARATFRTTALRVISGDHYARALEGLAENQTELMEVALKDMREGTIDAAQARVEIDARKWFASKFLPKRYGDRVAHDHGGQPGNPFLALVSEVSGRTFDPVPDAALDDND